MNPHLLRVPSALDEPSLAQGPQRTGWTLTCSGSPAHWMNPHLLRVPSALDEPSLAQGPQRTGWTLTCSGSPAHWMNCLGYPNGLTTAKYFWSIPKTNAIFQKYFQEDSSYFTIVGPKLGLFASDHWGRNGVVIKNTRKVWFQNTFFMPQTPIYLNPCLRYSHHYYSDYQYKYSLSVLRISSSNSSSKVLIWWRIYRLPQLGLYIHSPRPWYLQSQCPLSIVKLTATLLTALFQLTPSWLIYREKLQLHSGYLGFRTEEPGNNAITL